MNTTPPKLAVRRWMQMAHRWLGVFLLVQLLLWMASGAFMSLVSMDQVRGEPTRAVDASPELLPRAYFPPGGVIAGLGGVESVSLQNLGSRPVYIVAHSEGQTVFDAETGDPVTFPEAAIIDIARKSYVGEGEPLSARLLTVAPVDFRGAIPVWQVTIDDKAKTRIYVSPDTGKVLAFRNRLWRVYDFFWMLHIMDYGERSNYSNLLLRVFSVCGLLFVVTGGILAWTRVETGRYKQDIMRLIRKKKSLPD
jgi:uncharacterized iron-regulated membrane protein